MEYKSICCMCGRETGPQKNLLDHCYMKEDMGYIEVVLRWGIKLRALNFCATCSRKSYTIEDLKNIGNFRGWSY